MDILLLRIIIYSLLDSGPPILFYFIHLDSEKDWELGLVFLVCISLNSLRMTGRNGAEGFRTNARRSGDILQADEVDGMPASPELGFEDKLILQKCHVIRLLRALETMELKKGIYGSATKS
jgi:hypothetical protein